MLNKALLTPRNIAIIGVISVIAHVISSPLYRIINKKGSE